MERSGEVEVGKGGAGLSCHGKVGRLWVVRDWEGGGDTQEWVQGGRLRAEKCVSSLQRWSSIMQATRWRQRADRMRMGDRDCGWGGPIAIS